MKANEHKAYMTHRHDVKLDKDYSLWLRELKERYRNSQIKASVRVNVEKLLFNWQLGRDLAIRKAEERWGSGIVEQVSLDLQAEFPGNGFSANNLWMMKRWYLFYSQESAIQKLEQVGQELQQGANQRIVKLEQPVQEIEGQQSRGLSFPTIFGIVPWGHHVEILKKCKSIDEALYYISRTIEGGWSRSWLLERIREKDYEKRENHAINNFADHVPLPQAQLAEEITRENYDFGFLKLPKGYQELQLEDALCQQLSRFLLELGSGFAFLGRQKEIIVSGRSRRIDLLFYHIHLKAYVVVELKVVPFEPEFVGKLNFYVNAVDDVLRATDDNPTIGLLICAGMDETEVQYSFRGVDTPMGVAAYHNVQTLEAQLPTVEQLKRELEETKRKLIELQKAKEEGK